MKKQTYFAPRTEWDATLEQTMICDSLSGGIDDYDLIDNYQWEE